MSDRATCVRAALAVLVVALSVACGPADRPAVQPEAQKPDPFASVNPQIFETARAFPRWEQVETLTGSGTGIATVEVAGHALQWRARWRCDGSGGLSLSLIPSPEGALAEGECPGRGVGYGIDTGSLRLRVEAADVWEVIVEQEVDRPLHEPPLPEMTAAGATLLARGDFYEMERRGAGAALLYRLPDGSAALRLEDFATAPSGDLFVWASEAPQPQTAEEILATPYTELGELRSTMGDQNYRLPPEVDPGRVRSIVIWCEPIRIAYTAAALGLS